MFFIYKNIIDNFNKRNILILEETICAFVQKKSNLLIWELSKKRPLILLLERDFKEEKVVKKKLAYIQFLKLLIEIRQFKIILYAP